MSALRCDLKSYNETEPQPPRFMKLSMLPIITLLAAPVVAAEPTVPAIIPLPQNVESRQGAFKLEPKTRILTDAVARDTGQYPGRAAGQGHGL